MWTRRADKEWKYHRQPLGEEFAVWHRLVEHGRHRHGRDQQGRRAALVLPTGRIRRYPGIGDLNGIYIEGVCTNPQIIAVNEDGLGLGTAGLPASINYDGFWIDYENAIHGYIGVDGHRYAIIGDNIKGCGHWFRLEHDDQIITTKQPVILSADSATRLKALPVKKPQKIALRPPTPVIHIPKLTTPLPIDGDMEKWRTAGITPQVVITPETASGGITGPRDCSAVIRLAYEGNNLYIQVLRFDNVVTFRQQFWRNPLCRITLKCV